MSDIRDQRELDELRKRLYARGPVDTSVERHELTDNPVDVARSWNVPTEPEAATSEEDHPHRYRKFVLIASIAIFCVVAAASAAYFYFGNNRISGDNIAFNIAGNNNISGGETVSFQIGVTNQNTVAIEGASLIVKYPEGTRSITEPIKDLHEERIDVGMLGPGEAKNIQLQVAVYGKENQQLQIKATLEYRIVGSDGVFYKDAEPFNVQIISSPIILQVDSVRRVSAGQPVQITLKVKSNTNKVLKDVLITSKYPDGFGYKSASPEPLYNQNVWKLNELKPEETETIIINGSITGLTNEGLVVDFTAGAAEADNEFIVGSLLAEARAEFVLEKPFIAVDIEIAGDKDRLVVLDEGRSSAVQVSIKNTLKEPVYDMVVEVVPTGNALKADSVVSRQGFYDSNKNLVRFDVTNTSEFVRVEPGETRTLNFSIDPVKSNSAASFSVAVNVYAKRIAEPTAQQQLIGTVTAEARYASAASITSMLSYRAGPIPPTPGQATSYEAKVVARGGVNNLRNTVVTTSLPTYIEWKNEFSGPGTVTFNPVSRRLEWDIGDINSGTEKELTFTVDFLPSTSQVGNAPTIVNKLNFSAVDRFTNTPVTTSVEGVTSELTSGYGEGNGRVTQ
jgi:Domain of unknown function DUF11